MPLTAAQRLAGELALQNNQTQFTQERAIPGLSWSAFPLTYQAQSYIDRAFYQHGILYFRWWTSRDAKLPSHFPASKFVSTEQKAHVETFWHDIAKEDPWPNSISPNTLRLEIGEPVHQFPNTKTRENWVRAVDGSPLEYITYDICMCILIALTNILEYVDTSPALRILLKTHSHDTILAHLISLKGTQAAMRYMDLFRRSTRGEEITENMVDECELITPGIGQHEADGLHGTYGRARARHVTNPALLAKRETPELYAFYVGKGVASFPEKEPLGGLDRRHGAEYQKAYVVAKNAAGILPQPGHVLLYELDNDSHITSQQDFVMFGATHDELLGLVADTQYAGGHQILKALTNKYGRDRKHPLGIPTELRWAWQVAQAWIQLMEILTQILGGVVSTQSSKVILSWRKELIMINPHIYDTVGVQHPVLQSANCRWPGLEGIKVEAIQLGAKRRRTCHPDFKLLDEHVKARVAHAIPPCDVDDLQRLGMIALPARAHVEPFEEFYTNYCFDGRIHDIPFHQLVHTDDDTVKLRLFSIRGVTQEYVKAALEANPPPDDDSLWSDCQHQDVVNGRLAISIPDTILDLPQNDGISVRISFKVGAVDEVTGLPNVDASGCQLIFWDKYDNKCTIDRRSRTEEELHALWTFTGMTRAAVYAIRIKGRKEILDPIFRFKRVTVIIEEDDPIQAFPPDHPPPAPAQPQPLPPPPQRRIIDITGPRTNIQLLPRRHQLPTLNLQQQVLPFPAAVLSRGVIPTKVMVVAPPAIPPPAIPPPAVPPPVIPPPAVPLQVQAIPRLVNLPIQPLKQQIPDPAVQLYQREERLAEREQQLRDKEAIAARSVKAEAEARALLATAREEAQNAVQKDHQDLQTRLHEAEANVRQCEEAVDNLQLNAEAAQAEHDAIVKERDDLRESKEKAERDLRHLRLSNEKADKKADEKAEHDAENLRIATNQAKKIKDNNQKLLERAESERKILLKQSEDAAESARQAEQAATAQMKLQLEAARVAAEAEAKRAEEDSDRQMGKLRAEMEQQQNAAQQRLDDLTKSKEDEKDRAVSAVQTERDEQRNANAVLEAALKAVRDERDSHRSAKELLEKKKDDEWRAALKKGQLEDDRRKKEMEDWAKLRDDKVAKRVAAVNKHRKYWSPPLSPIILPTLPSPPLPLRHNGDPYFALEEMARQRKMFVGLWPANTFPNDEFLGRSLYHDTNFACLPAQGTENGIIMEVRVEILPSASPTHGVPNTERGKSLGAFYHRKQVNLQYHPENFQIVTGAMLGMENGQESIIQYRLIPDIGTSSWFYREDHHGPRDRYLVTDFCQYTIISHRAVGEGKEESEFCQIGKWRITTAVTKKPSVKLERVMKDHEGKVYPVLPYVYEVTYAAERIG